MSLVFEVQGIERIQDMYKKSPVVINKWLLRALNASLMELQKNNRKGVTPWDTGSLSQTFQWEAPKATNGEFSTRFFPTREYAPFVYFGTKNQKPQKYLDAILDLSRLDIQRHFDDAIEKAVDEITK